jgi:hypothetical protein
MTSHCSFRMEHPARTVEHGHFKISRDARIFQWYQLHLATVDARQEKLLERLVVLSIS